MFLFIVLLIIFGCLFYNIKWTKQEIADDYRICRKTLGKWVRFCSPNIEYEKWNKLRKLDVLDVLFIYFEFGMPKENKAVTKGEIVEKCETYYHTVRENVALNMQKLGISKETYSSLDIFPPKLSARIVETMG